MPGREAQLDGAQELPGVAPERLQEGDGVAVKLVGRVLGREAAGCLAELVAGPEEHGCRVRWKFTVPRMSLGDTEPRLWYV